MNNMQKAFKAKAGLGAACYAAGTPFVRGPKGVDKVPVHLSRGEAVLPVKTVQKMGGAPAVHSLIKNTTGVAPKGGLRRGGHYDAGVVDETPEVKAARLKAASDLHAINNPPGIDPNRFGPTEPAAPAAEPAPAAPAAESAPSAARAPAAEPAAPVSDLKVPAASAEPAPATAPQGSMLDRAMSAVRNGYDTVKGKFSGGAEAAAPTAEQALRAEQLAGATNTGQRIGEAVGKLIPAGLKDAQFPKVFTGSNLLGAAGVGAEALLSGKENQYSNDESIPFADRAAHTARSAVEHGLGAAGAVIGGTAGKGAGWGLGAIPGALAGGYVGDKVGGVIADAGGKLSDAVGLTNPANTYANYKGPQSGDAAAAPGSPAPNGGGTTIRQSMSPDEIRAANASNLARYNAANAPQQRQRGVIPPPVNSAPYVGGLNRQSIANYNAQPINAHVDAARNGMRQWAMDQLNTPVHSISGENLRDKAAGILTSLEGNRTQENVQNMHNNGMLSNTEMGTNANAVNQDQAFQQKTYGAGQEHGYKMEELGLGRALERQKMGIAAKTLNRERNLQELQNANQDYDEKGNPVMNGPKYTEALRRANRMLGQHGLDMGDVPMSTVQALHTANKRVNAENEYNNTTLQRALQALAIKPKTSTSDDLSKYMATSRTPGILGPNVNSGIAGAVPARVTSGSGFFGMPDQDILDQEEADIAAPRGR